MSPALLQKVAHEVEEATGIRLERQGQLERLDRFLRERVERGQGGPEGMLAELARGGAEADALVQVVTVGHTWFFRDPEQLEAIGKLFREAWPAGRPLRVWVPGCSTGEDAWALAMLAMEAGRPIRVLGTDLNAASLSLAERGEYPPAALREVPDRLGPFFAPGKEARAVAPALRNSVQFARHNLVGGAAPGGDEKPWDLVLCRNVLIYFRPERARAALQRLVRSLAPGGWLFVGVGEVLSEAPPGTSLVQVGARSALCRSVGLGGELLRFPAPAPKAAPRIPTRTEPASPRAALALVADGNRKLDRGELAAALEQYERALAADALCVEARLFAGMAHHLRDEPARAVPELRAALCLRPALWPASFYLALSYDRLGLTVPAQREYAWLVGNCSATVPLGAGSELFEDLLAMRQKVEQLARQRSASARSAWRQP